MAIHIIVRLLLRLVAMTDHGYQVEIAEGYDEAVIRTRLALRAEGFSILTEAHVGEMLTTPDAAGRQYLIMGAWNATAAQTLGDSDVSVGVHLSCNVVIHESGSTAIVAALDPADTHEASDSQSEELVNSARGALQRVLTKVADNS
jgi:uncharacterized protein (DUF302 family)